MHTLPAGDVERMHISHICLPHSLDTAGGAHDGVLSKNQLVWLTPHAHSRSARPGCSFHVRLLERRRPRCCRLQLPKQAAQGSSSRWRRPTAVPPLRQLLLLLIELKQAMAACLRWGPVAMQHLHVHWGVNSGSSPKIAHPPAKLQFVCADVAPHPAHAGHPHHPVGCSVPPCSVHLGMCDKPRCPAAERRPACAACRSGSHWAGSGHPAGDACWQPQAWRRGSPEALCGGGCRSQRRCGLSSAVKCTC